MFRGIFTWLFDGAARAPRPQTVDIDLLGLELPVRGIRIGSPSGDRTTDCALRWNELEDILAHTPGRETPSQAVRDLHNALNVIAGTLMVSDDPPLYRFTKSTFDAISRGTALIYEAAETYQRHAPPAQHGADGDNNVVPFANAARKGAGQAGALSGEPAEPVFGRVMMMPGALRMRIEGDTIHFDIPQINRAPELYSFIENFKPVYSRIEEAFTGRTHVEVSKLPPPDPS